MGDDAEARRLFRELRAAGAPPTVQAEALAALAAAHGVRHEQGVEVGFAVQGISIQCSGPVPLVAQSFLIGALACVLKQQCSCYYAALLLLADISAGLDDEGTVIAML